MLEHLDRLSEPWMISDKGPIFIEGPRHQQAQLTRHEILTVISAGVRPVITQRKAARKRLRKQSPQLPAFSTPPTRSVSTSVLWVGAGLSFTTSVDVDISE